MMGNKTLIELRKEFEEMAINKIYSIERSKKWGEYKKCTTQQLWCGYFMCAVNNEILIGGQANILKMNKWD